MSKSAFIFQRSFLYLVSRRAWVGVLAMCWLLGLLVISVPEHSSSGGGGSYGLVGAQASLAHRSLQKPDKSANRQPIAVEPANPNTHTPFDEMPTRIMWAPIPVSGESEQFVYDSAVKSFREGRYAAAFGRFTQLADVGHKASAESALFMLRHGQELFGAAWSASEDEQLLWAALVAQAGNALLDNPAGD